MRSAVRVLARLVVAGMLAVVLGTSAEAAGRLVPVAGNNDLEHSIEVLNKGAGPAIVRSAQVFVDGKPQRSWDAVLDALGIAKPHPFQQSTINPNVLTPGERVTAIKFPDEELWKRFRSEATQRVWMNICFCSSLDDCWLYSDQRPVGYKIATQLVNPVSSCPHLRDEDIFNN